MSGAACAGHSEPLWDSHLDGETVKERDLRHARAVEICRGCPIRRQCAASVDPKHDDGVRGGLVLPIISDKRRQAPYQPGFLDYLIPETTRPIRTERKAS